jgi:hypothetical protein
MRECVEVIIIVNFYVTSAQKILLDGERINGRCYKHSFETIDYGLDSLSTIRKRS